MSDLKLYGSCETCKKKRFFIRKRVLKLPIGKEAKSQKKMCNSCFKNIRAVISTKIHD